MQGSPKIQLKTKGLRKEIRIKYHVSSQEIRIVKEYSTRV